MTRLRIQTPSRLHFGLLGWGASSRRQFGGVGLMVEQPGLEIVAENASDWSIASGPLSERTLDIAVAVARRLDQERLPVRPVRFTNVRVPEAHMGLGVGTQLSLAVARAIATLAGQPELDAASLARLTDRGRRSGIGIHGFAEGGLIVDAGRHSEKGLPTKLVRLPFPDEWSTLIVLPEQAQGLHGDEELTAFRTLPPMPESLSSRLCRLVLLGLLPAVLETDLESFGSSLSEIQRIVGSSFAAVQGGPFGNSEIDVMVESMARNGLHGVGQSSWGPALYAFSDQGPRQRERLRLDLIGEFHLDPDRVFWTRASRSGATVTTF